MLVLLLRCWYIIKSNSSIKLTQSNLFRIQFIEKNNFEGGLIKRDLREMIGNELILNSPPYSLVYSIFVDDTYA